VLLRIVGMNDQYERMLRENPERLFLQNDALPWVSASYKQVLFVGTAVYTYQYEKLFADDPDRYTTIDRNPSTKVWGGKHHIVAPIEQIDQYRPPGFFDCIVLSGVLAYRIPEHGDYGLVEQDDLRALLKVLHGVLRPGGLLLRRLEPPRHGAIAFATRSARSLFCADRQDALGHAEGISGRSTRLRVLREALRRLSDRRRCVRHPSP
jgi:hypothetical protein